jgi:putative heme-binding domain-containing protein
MISFRCNKKFLCSLILIFSISVQSAYSADSNLNMIFKYINKSNDEQVQYNMLKGVTEGLISVNKMEAPQAWHELNAKLSTSKNEELKKLLAELNQKFGNEEAIQKALATVKDSNASIEDRKIALISLVSQKNKALLPELEALLSSELHTDAIRAYGAFNEESIPAKLLKHYPKFDEASKRAVVETLSTRKEFAKELLEALKNGTVKKNEIPAYIARNLKSILGESFNDVYGDTQQLSEDKTKLIATYKSKLNSPAFTKADAANGRAVYQRSCAVCHKLYDTGGIIGPDLTGSNRADPDYILLNIIDPSFDMPEAYRMVTVTKKDGQILSGNIVEEDQQKIVISMVGAKTLVSKADIKSRVVSKVSMMPEGLLNTLNDKEFLDLIKYLQTEKQVGMPK